MLCCNSEDQEMKNGLLSALLGLLTPFILAGNLDSEKIQLPLGSMKKHQKPGNTGKAQKQQNWIAIIHPISIPI